MHLSISTKERLIETILWCASARIDPSLPDLSTTLRTPALRPRRLFLTSDSPTSSEIFEASPEEADEIVEEVARRRRDAITTSALGPVDIASELKSGWLLAYYPGLTLCDGLSKEMSRGLFDVFDHPPWDTWMFYDRSDDPNGYDALLAWIPGPLVEAADAGIAAAPTDDCITWARQELLDEIMSAHT